MAWIVTVVALGAAAPASARPDAATLKKATAHFKLGQEFFKTRQWDRAIAEYQAALDLTGEPAMVFNIALAHDRAERYDQALATFQRYLELAPDGAIADEARQDVARLTSIVEKIRADRAAEDAHRGATAKRVHDEANQRAEAARRAALDRANRAQVASRADALDRRGRIQRWSGVTLAGLGLAGVGLGVRFGLDARAIATELEAHQGAWTDAQIALDAEGRSANTKMIALTAVGSAVVVVGGVLYVIGRGNARRAVQLRGEARAPASALSLGARATPGGGLVTLAVRF